MNPSIVLAALALVLATITHASGAEPSYISTVVGNGTPCSPTTAACGDGGPVVLAAFNSPRGLTLTPDGGYLVADRYDHRIRKVSGSLLGVIATWAGTGIPCTPTTAPCGDGGPASAAQLTIPRTTSLTAGGGYLIADEGDHRIRQVSALSPTGVITTVAGTGIHGYSGDGGPATQAMLWFPHAVAALANGDFLIADTYNHRVRLVSGGIITTVAGTGREGYSGDGGPATAAQLKFPHGLAPLPGGGFLVADSDNKRVRQVSPGGIITTVAGDGTTCTDPTAPVNPCGDNGPATSAQLALPRSIALLPGGGFVFSDVDTNSVRQVSATGIITTVAGNGIAGFSGDGGLATAAELNGPQDVAVRADGSLLIADAAEAPTPGYGNERIRLVTQIAAAGVALNSDVYHPGQTLTYQAMLSTGGAPPPAVDIYLGAYAAAGLIGHSTVPFFVSIIGSGVSVDTRPFTILTNLRLTETVIVPFSLTILPLGIPFLFLSPGTYFAYAAIVPAGGDPFQPLSLAVNAFTLLP